MDGWILLDFMTLRRNREDAPPHLQCSGSGRVNCIDTGPCSGAKCLESLWNSLLFPLSSLQCKIASCSMSYELRTGFAGYDAS